MANSAPRCANAARRYDFHSVFERLDAGSRDDKLSDPSAPLEERAQRRRRLTKGPSEFRE